jgi:hypothetical protein
VGDLGGYIYTGCISYSGRAFGDNAYSPFYGDVVYNPLAVSPGELGEPVPVAAALPTLQAPSTGKSSYLMSSPCNFTHFLLLLMMKSCV